MGKAHSLSTYLGIILFLIIAENCSSMQVHAYTDKSVDFSQYRSFEWMQTKDWSENSYFDNAKAETDIQSLASTELKKRGLVQDTKNPDLLVEYHSIVKKEYQTVRTPILGNTPYSYNPAFNFGGMGYGGMGYGGMGGGYGPGYGYGGGYNPMYPYGYNNVPYMTGGYQYSQTEIELGTLVIDVIDRKRNRLIWRAKAKGTLSDPASLDEQLPQDIKKMFELFPISAIPVQELP